MARPGGGRWITPGILPSALRAAPQAARSRSLPAILSNHSGGSHPPPWHRVCDLYPSRSPLRGGQAGGGRWIRTTEGVSQQIYSLPPLAAWVSLQQRTRIVGGTCGSVNNNGASDCAHARMAMADLPGSGHPPSVRCARSDRCIAWQIFARLSIQELHTRSQTASGSHVTYLAQWRAVTFICHCMAKPCQRIRPHLKR